MKLTATADVLRGLTGVVIKLNALGHPTVWSVLGGRHPARRGGPCEMVVFTDGREDDDGLVLTFVRPDDLEAVEVYTNESKLPAEFRWHPRASCGVVLLWTRAGNPSQQKRQ